MYSDNFSSLCCISSLYLVPSNAVLASLNFLLNKRVETTITMEDDRLPSDYYHHCLQIGVQLEGLSVPLVSLSYLFRLNDSDLKIMKSAVT